ncbi:MAG: c-type cytochrome, partial [Pseudomonadota bacterium]
NGQDDVLVYSPEAHIPKDQPVKFLLRSKDVLHNFTVTQFRVKMDLVPGMNTFLWLTPTVNGRFEVLCEELCGIGHHTMRGAVIVEDQADFDTWLAAQPTYAELNAKPAGNATVGQAMYGVCAACHGQQGEGIFAVNGPKLAGQSDWYLKRQIMAYKNGLRGTNPEDAIGAPMIGMVNLLADEAAIDNVVAHITSLPDNPPEKTIDGDLEEGERLYSVCAYCHGDAGEGKEALNAPRLAGMSDWYIERQLMNFKNDVRGAHPQDYYGFQMGLMSQSLHSEQAMKDIVAYINTL